MSEEGRPPPAPAPAIGAPPPRKPPEGGGMGWAVGVLAVIAAVAIILNAIAEERAKQDQSMGMEAPDFTLRKLEGGKVSLADFKGRVVVLDFWATWCAPCVEEMPHLVKVVKELEPDVALVAINQDDPGSDALVEKFATVTTPGLKPYVAMADERTIADYQITQLPTMILVDRDGKIAQTYSGFADASTLRKRIQKVLER